MLNWAAQFVLRFNNMLYTTDKICFICGEINSADNDHTIKHLERGELPTPYKRYKYKLLFKLHLLKKKIGL